MPSAAASAPGAGPGLGAPPDLPVFTVPLMALMGSRQGRVGEEGEAGGGTISGCLLNRMMELGFQSGDLTGGRSSLLGNPGNFSLTAFYGIPNNHL